MLRHFVKPSGRPHTDSTLAGHGSKDGGRAARAAEIKPWTARPSLWEAERLLVRASGAKGSACSRALAPGEPRTNPGPAGGGHRPPGTGSCASTLSLWPFSGPTS